MNHIRHITAIMVVAFSAIAGWSKEPDTRQILLFDYPVVESNDNKYFYQDLPELRFHYASYYDSISVLIKKIPVLKANESYSIKYVYHTYSKEPRLYLKKGTNAQTIGFLQTYSLRLGFVDICGNKIPVEIDCNHWPCLRDVLYETLEKTDRSSTIKTKVDDDPVYYLFSNDYYFFEFEDNYSKITFKGKEVEK